MIFSENRCPLFGIMLNCERLAFRHVSPDSDGPGRDVRPGQDEQRDRRRVLHVLPLAGSVANVPGGRSERHTRNLRGFGGARLIDPLQGRTLVL